MIVKSHGMLAIGAVLAVLLPPGLAVAVIVLTLWCKRRSRFPR
jgi:hypothetical protein